MNANPDVLPETAGLPPARSRSPFTPLGVRDLEQLPPPAWLIGDLLPIDGLAMLFGSPGSGKSMIALDLALSIAAGTAGWFSHAVTAGTAVYALGEGLRGLSRRIEGWCCAHPGADLKHFMVVPALPALHEPTQLDEFLEELAAAGVLGPRLIVIDTLARAIPGIDENDAGQVGLAIAGVDWLRRETKAAVLLVHHQGWGPQKRERGSTALRAACDAVLGLSKDDDGRRQLELVKQRDGEDGTKLDLRFVPAGPSVVLMPTEVVPARLTPKQVDALRTLESLEGRATFTRWVEKTPAARSTASDAINILVALGYAEKGSDANYTLTEKGRKEVRSPI